MGEKILVAIDGSEQSFKALEVARALSQGPGTTLDLLHVVPVRALPEGLAEWARSEHIEHSVGLLYERAIADRVLDAAVEKLGGNGAPRVQKLVEHGDPVERILAVAKREGVDRIVMGTRGLSRLKGLTVGSVAQRVLHGAKCTVIAVK